MKETTRRMSRSFTGRLFPAGVRIQLSAGHVKDGAFYLHRFKSRSGRMTAKIRAMLDGTQAALPYEGQISDGADKGPNARRFTFIFASVTPGVHNVKIQYQMTSQGGFADMNAHNTIVSFAPK